LQDLEEHSLLEEDETALNGFSPVSIWELKNEEQRAAQVYGILTQKRLILIHLKQFSRIGKIELIPYKNFQQLILTRLRFIPIPLMIIFSIIMPLLSVLIYLCFRPLLYSSHFFSIFPEILLISLSFVAIAMSTLLLIRIFKTMDVIVLGIPEETLLFQHIYGMFRPKKINLFTIEGRNPEYQSHDVIIENLFDLLSKYVKFTIDKCDKTTYSVNFFFELPKDLLNKIQLKLSNAKESSYDN
jgi:hypothetical protein